MSVNITQYQSILSFLKEKNANLVAVSKTKPVEDILELYHLGQRDFGENYVQELVEKFEKLPEDIQWHFIGHLQTNKVKFIAPFVHLIHSVDSEKLLIEIDKQAKKNGRIIQCLLQVHIAKEETKFGFDALEARVFLNKVLTKEIAFANIRITGLMGMASFTDEEVIVSQEFQEIEALYNEFKESLRFTNLSIGMSSDYQLAVIYGGNMVRIGSLLFGARNYNK